MKIQKQWSRTSMRHKRVRRGRPPTLQSGRKARCDPRQSFEEAVKTSGLSEEQQHRLLSFRD